MIAVMAPRMLVAALLFLLSSSVFADRLCDLMNTFGCSAPFVPGHKWMGDSWWAIGDRKTTILHLSTTLNIPNAPESVDGVLAINTAMENTDISDKQDLHPVGQTFQAITAAYPKGWKACEQTDNQWCAFQSIYSTTLEPPQINHPPYAVGKGSISLQWTYYPNNQTMLQNARQTGLVMATQEPPRQWWPKTECQCSAKGTIPAHHYTQTTVKLEKPLPNFGDTVSSHRASSTRPYTIDDGTTWQIDRIDVSDAWCQNTEPCPDADAKQPERDWGITSGGKRIVKAQKAAVTITTPMPPTVVTPAA